MTNSWDDEEQVLARDLFGTTGRRRAEAAIIDWVHAVGHLADRVLDIEMSVGAVAICANGLRDRLIVKVWPPHIEGAGLAAQTRLQGALADIGFPAPRVMAGPKPFQSGYAVLMAYDRRGQPTDCRIAGVGEGMARGLYRLIETIACQVSSVGLPHRVLPSVDAIWPRPHSAWFDFAGTARGAEPIDAMAREALMTMHTANGRLVAGYHDWSAKNVRMNGTDIAVVYDWDSVFIDRETLIVGSAAAHFPLTWELQVPPTPERAQVGAFVRAYEAARGTPFTAAEIAEIAVSITYARAYKARCEHAGDPLGRDQPGSSREDLLTFGPFPASLLSARHTGG